MNEDNNVVEGSFPLKTPEQAARELKSDLLDATLLEVKKLLDQGADSLLIIGSYPDARALPGYVALNSNSRIGDFLLSLESAKQSLMDRARGLVHGQQ